MIFAINWSQCIKVTPPFTYIETPHAEIMNAYLVNSHFGIAATRLRERKRERKRERERERGRDSVLSIICSRYNLSNILDLLIHIELTTSCATNCNIRPENFLKRTLFVRALHYLGLSSFPNRKSSVNLIWS